MTLKALTASSPNRQDCCSPCTNRGSGFFKRDHLLRYIRLHHPHAHTCMQTNHPKPTKSPQHATNNLGCQEVKTITCSHQQRRAVVRDAHSTPNNNRCGRVQTTKPQRHSYAFCTRPVLQGHQVAMLQQKNPVQAARPCNTPLSGPSSRRPSPWGSSMLQAACPVRSKPPTGGRSDYRQARGRKLAGSERLDRSKHVHSATQHKQHA